ncbi:T9SS type A sorting domain-containing protein [Bacteroidia bacterium]|nr:T9SS type A sorting domain-containing protein [Bacteroidia bacterium]
MKKIYSVVFLLFFSLWASAQCSDLFISEYAEGSSNNKYLEIYNASADDINLEDYLLVSCSNGCGNSGLNGSWELTFIGVGPSKGNVDWYNTSINASTRGCLADDRVVFHKSGAFQNVMGSETWIEGWQGATADGCATPVSPFDGSKLGSWKDNGDGTFTVYGKGSHVGIPKPYNGGELSSVNDAKDSIIYEYVIDGDTAMTVDISIGGGYWRYSYKKVSNSFEYDNSFLFSGQTVKAGEVFVISHSSADATILAESDVNHNFLSNGDDWYALWRASDYSFVDEVGELGDDPGNGWDASGTTNATQNHTLVRKASVKEGAVWSTSSADQWEVKANNTWTNLGGHACDCYPAAAPEVQFSNTKYFVDENAGTASVEISIKEPSSVDATTVEVTITGGTAVDGTDYTVTSSTMLTFAAGDATSQTVTMNIVDNSDGGLNKDITLALSNLSANAILGADSIAEVVIVNDDYIVSDIIDVVDLDVDLSPNNKGVKYEVTGVVYGIDYDGNAGLSFTIIDATSGINIFNFVDVNDYVVTEGDEITARGQIDFYNGLLELKVDSIKVNSQGNALATPTVVTVPTEDTESEFIQLEKVWIADTTTVWPNNGNVKLTNADADTFQIRVDKDATTIVGQPVSYDTMTIVGIGGQFDNSAPYDEGYQIFPRYLSDIQEWVDRSSVSELVLDCRVYPNPTAENLTVLGTERWATYEIYSVSGIKVANGSFVNNNLSVANLEAGNYIIRMASNEKSGVAQFIIVR